MDEHRRAAGKENSTSGFARHLAEEQHNCDFMDFKILHQANKGRLLDRLETIEIKTAISDNSIKLVNYTTFLSQPPLLD